MAFPENNEKNRFELAANIVSSWSREELEDYIIREFEADYRDGLGCFEEHWDDFKGSFEWSQELRESVKKDCPNPGCCCGACDKKEESFQIKKVKEGLE